MADRVTERLNVLVVKLGHLSSSSLVTFSVTCAMQVFPFLEQWSQQEGNNLAVYARDCLDFARSIADQQPGDFEALNERIRKLDEQIPDTEESGTVSPSGALDAALCVLSVMRCVLSPLPQHAFDAAQGAIVAYELTSDDPMLSDLVTVADHINRDLAFEALIEWNRQIKLIETLS